ncbi:acyl-CoA thioester hydrolase/BAAT C-terminal domain-containing protein [Nocardioides sp. LHD-245]|uniref:acyl-CoA thioester hydrolase/BAAT C-terminal domain-containing protein n=1 Tax=Nocardioides sp. LHD-245 TaxID=3051387 RepID=UPI0027E0D2DD|nr:acyl-CoA thioester hydrolase/BAAT C-terminal domain-containing protein [Nocardioides sp. LHD-245]
MSLAIDGPAHRSLADTPFDLRVTGAAPHEPVTFTVELPGFQGADWSGTFTATANAHGTVDLATTALDGFAEPDPTALLWSLEPRPVAAEPVPADDELGWTLRVSQGDRSATEHYVREFRGRGVSAHELSAPLAGRLYLPPGPGPRPAVITLSGSGGGINDEEAMLLASRGFVCLALACFNYPGRPDDLLELPVEYVASAATWLAARDEVQPGAIAVKGQSRGAELALLVGAHVPGVRAVVAVVPSGYVWGSFTSDGREGAAWTLGGEPVPAVLDDGIVPGRSVETASGIAAAPGFRAAIEATAPDDLDRATIPIERLDGPLLLLCGGDDLMWDSVELSEVLLRRRAAGTSAPTRREVFPGAGHNLGLPFTPVVTGMVHPVNGVAYAYGGTRPGTARARVAAWTAFVDFLEETLT